MCKELQPTTGTITTAVAICKATSEHSTGNAVIANLLNTSIPTEQVIQQAMPNGSWASTLVGMVSKTTMSDELRSNI